MARSAVPAVIDYLVSTFTTAVSGLALPKPCRVYDGVAVGSVSDDLVIVGSGSDADASTAAQRTFVNLGAFTREEDFTIVCYVRSYRGGADQKAPRDAAFLIFDALENALRADLSLGGTVKPYPVEISTQNYVQTAPSDSSQGRISLIEFGVHVRNRY